MPAFVTRSPFVGREAELGRLRDAFDAAASGEGALAFVVGEPGIGKTSLCGQLAAYAVARGGQALTGHCYEEGSLSLPYLPFVEALRAYVLDRGRESLRRELGPHAADVARIVPELRDILNVEPGPATDPESDRYRLLQAITAFLREIAAARPLLLVLEDLHDADRGTLDLLLHLARNLTSARMLVAGTYRDVEVDRAHPLSGALAELRRAAPVGRVRLGGLTVEEAGQVVSAVAGEVVPHSIAEAVHRQTEGNPLFVQEVALFLVEEGLASGTQGGGGVPLALRIPEGLRDVIGKRLSRLSAECNRVLAIAAVIGREFDLLTLRALAGLADEAVDSALEEACRAGVLEEQERPGAVRYRFAHAFFRQTLYEELSAPRRLRLHQHVARALEARYAARLPEHAAELADHFAHSTDPADLAKAVEYGELAARRASDVYAYGEAARLLEQALDVQDVLDPADTARRCDLLLALATALNEAGEPRRVLDRAALQAFALAETLGDRARVSRACTEARWALASESAAAPFATPEWAAWAERASRWAGPDTPEEAWADMQAGMVCYMRGDWQSATRLATRALALARRFNDPELLWEAAMYCLCFCVTAPHRAEERARLAEEMSAWPRDGFRTRPMLYALVYPGSVFLEQGERERAESVWQERAALVERTGQAFWRLNLVQEQGILATLDGRLEDAVHLGEQAERGYAELGIPVIGRLIRAIGSCRALLYLGRAEDLLQLSTSPKTAALCLAAMGRVEDVRVLLDEFAVQRPLIGTPEDETPGPLDHQYLEAAVLTGHAEAAALLLRRLAGHPLVVSSWSYPVCPARLLGAAAALLGDREGARRWSEQALADATRVRFRPEIALTHLQLAELLEHYPDQRAEAVEHLELAIPELREMQMQPALERALHLREQLERRTLPRVGSETDRLLSPEGMPSERRLMTVLFTDIAGSTERAAALGDRRWVELKARHHALVRRELARFGGHEVDTAGDGFFATFETPARAVRCAWAVRDAVRELGLEVRAGLHFGEVEVQDTGVSGIAVHTGARVMALAGPGEVLVSRTVRDLVAGAGIRFAERGTHSLKGVPGEWTLFAVEATDD